MGTEDLRQRLAAILAADAAGYSRLMSADEHATVAALDAAREVFRRRAGPSGGRVIDTAGDSVLAVFDLATGAVGAALEIQGELDALARDLPEDRRLRFRIGVHMGEVIEKPDGSVYGDGVNVAARLQGLAEPGGITVSDSVRAAVRAKMAVAFEDLGAQQVKNIAEPVQAYRVRPALSPPGAASAAGAASASTVAPSVAVLPFDNMSGDPEQAYIADGITEDLITALAKFHWLRVIARNSSFQFRGRSVDVRKAAEELGARFLVEGSVRKAGTRLRITAQLLDGATGAHIWADRYDREVQDLFVLQDEIVSMIVGRLEPELGRVERMRAMSRPTRDLGAWDCYHLGLSHMYRFTASDNLEAQRLMRRAAELDPRFALAHARLAYCLILEMVYFGGHPTAQVLDEALRAARQAVDLDAEDAFCLMALGRVHIARRDYDLGMSACRSAVALNPGMGIAFCGMGDALAYSGRPTEAIACFEEAVRLSPNDPWRWAFFSYGALALILDGQYERAAEWAQKAILVPNCQYWARAHLAAAFGHLGRRAEAEAALAEVKKSQPGFSLDAAREQLFYLQSAEQVERYLEGLRRAGLGQ